MRIASTRVRAGGDVPALEVQLGQAQPRVPAEGRRPGLRHDELEAAAGFGGLSRGALELTGQQDDVGTRSRRQGPAEDILLERPSVVHALLLRRPAIDRKEHRKAERARFIRGIEPARFVQSRGVVVEVEEGQGQSGARPENLRHLRIRRHHPAVGLDGRERLARRAAPPAQPQQPRVDEKPRAAVRERLQARDGILVLAESSERVAEPEGRFARDGGRQGLLNEPCPDLARLGVPPETVERDRAAVLHPRQQLGRRPVLGQRVERRERARRIARHQRKPGVFERCVKPDVRARGCLDDEEHRPGGRLSPVEADQGFGLPVPRLAKHVRVARAPDRAFEGQQSVVVLAALEAGAAALDQLGDDTEDAAQRVAREEARQRRGRHGLGGQIRHDPRPRQRRHRLG